MSSPKALGQYCPLLQGIKNHRPSLRSTSIPGEGPLPKFPPVGIPLSQLQGAGNNRNRCRPPRPALSPSPAQPARPQLPSPQPAPSTLLCLPTSQALPSARAALRGETANPAAEAVSRGRAAREEGAGPGRRGRGGEPLAQRRG